MSKKELSLKIQPLKESDLLAIRALSAGSEGLAPDRDSFYWLFSEFFNKTSIVACSEDKVVGFILGFINQADPTQGYVYSIGVASDYQRKGIGKLLLESFQESIHSYGANTVYLTTTPENTKALSFYEHMGFNKPEQFMKFGQLRLKLFKNIK